jgi:hypothetical protein
MFSRSARYLSISRIIEFPALVLLALLFLAWLAFSNTRTTVTHFTSAPTLSTDVDHLWAQYSPYFPVAKYKPLPQGCKISQVSISFQIHSINPNVFRSRSTLYVSWTISFTDHSKFPDSTAWITLSYIWSRNRHPSVSCKINGGCELYRSSTRLLNQLYI